MKLYEIKEQIQLLDRFIEQNELDKEDFKEAFNQIEGTLEEKAEGYVKYMRNLSAEAEAFKVEADRMSDKARTLKNHADRIKNTLDETLRELDIKELKAGLFNLKYQKNPPSVNILDMELIPENYKLLQEIKLDKKAILQDIKAGQEVAGAELTQGESLRIR